MNLNSVVVGICGSGAMGSGIAQVAATAGHSVVLYDNRSGASSSALQSIRDSLGKLEAKGKLSVPANDIASRIKAVDSLQDFKQCGLIIEAIVENLNVKAELFQQLEKVVSMDAVLASNTSSLSITAIAGACAQPERVAGLHFFNPAPLMPLVEVIPGMQTNAALPQQLKELMLVWKKVPVIAKDTPGFIVNRVARPFYGEALRICEEGLADFSSVDAAMKESGFKMGPFELMDLIGNDVNYAVTETVWTQCYFDSRYKPSVIQKRMVESGRFGRKSGRGYYEYNGEVVTKMEKTESSTAAISDRIIAMLINEAADALHFGIAGRDDLDLAMTKGVNYPKGLLHWCDEIGAAKVLQTIDNLYDTYREDRYRASSLLRMNAAKNQKFFTT
jgi:3-hydroxybutyryl-CoA dehydrogenase